MKILFLLRFTLLIAAAFFRKYNRFLYFRDIQKFLIYGKKSAILKTIIAPNYFLFIYLQHKRITIIIQFIIQIFSNEIILY